MGSTLGQTSLGQLAAVNSCPLDDMEMRARCLSLLGKTLRLLAVQEDPVYMSSLWDRHLKVQNNSLKFNFEVKEAIPFQSVTYLFL